ncbi:response regulator [Enterocloster bolteae]|uniref:response regulator n=1 Tax=Enterocloster bolteae TaxID=208479 RepID=UPI00210F0014|nr:response regulator [Enterocloster bolteae]MCQ5143857.1 response regulator [Enterocloster bolteae]
MSEVAESKLNQGTKFVIVHPLEKSDTPAENYGAEISKQELSEVLGGKRILLAEDNEINREIIIALLEEAGAVVDAVENGAVAAELFSGSSKGYYSIIFMDIQIPVMNGLEAAKAIRNADASYPTH